jgi:hypothetical protein
MSRQSGPSLVAILPQRDKQPDNQPNRPAAPQTKHPSIANNQANHLGIHGITWIFMDFNGVQKFSTGGVVGMSGGGTRAHRGPARRRRKQKAARRRRKQKATRRRQKQKSMRGGHWRRLSLARSAAGTIALTLANRSRIVGFMEMDRPWSARVADGEF